MKIQYLLLASMCAVISLHGMEHFKKNLHGNYNNSYVPKQNNSQKLTHFSNAQNTKTQAQSK